ncbi:MAG: putative selenium-dependent hydroxylase accessory protein YqeC [Treponema sp.]|jgi:probable selenium-dependent hydroxylase accessory protein YqeC|nr:putative selenium-dependent hydroxylase accessory protein YqeC [Treponema sp.]
MSVTDYLSISTGSVVAVVGCGGKTSLIELVADRLRDKKVLISTTTKIFPPKMKDIVLCETLGQCEGHEPRTGVQCMGLLNRESGKLEALPEALLARLRTRYDIVLLEADGSRGLNCKGWLENEPVVPSYCTHTVGIVTMNALGKPAGETTVHRLPEFFALTGVGEGQTITLAALEAMVCDPNGMFKNSAGQRYVVVNQAEDAAASRAALTFLQGIKEKYPARFEKLLYGSVHNDAWQGV